MANEHNQNLLLKEGRSFIREGPIHMSQDKKLKKYYLYLFSDMLVFADVNEASDEKFFESILSLTGSEIKDVADSPVTRHFQAKSRARTFSNADVIT